MKKFVILIPSYNDWDCLDLLIPAIDKAVRNIKNEISILVVNDGSTLKHNLSFKKNILKINEIRILNLKKNVKAQIAISTGLDQLRNEKFLGGVIIMDADGQDDPEKLPTIIEASNEDDYQTITVNRTKREEEILFQIFYKLYLILAFVLTFKYLKYGVFSYIHSSSIDKILSTNEVFMAYVAGLAKHFKNKKIIYAERKKRITGKSQNNYLSLLHYALKIISAFRYQALLNSTIIFILFMLSINFGVIPKFSLLFPISLLIFNSILFLMPKKLDKKIISEPLQNVENIEKL